MPKTHLTPAHIRFIKKNRLKMSGSDMACKFGIDKNIVGRYMRKNKLTPSKKYILKFRSQGVLRKFDPNSKENKFIKKNYLKVPLKRLSVMMGHTESFVYGRLKRLKLKVPEEIVKQRKIDSQIKPGNVPANKGKRQKDYMSKKAIARTKATRFKKGQIPANAVGFKNGDITVREHRNQKSYCYIRTGLGKWQLLHQYNWEKKYKKKFPTGYCLWFKDGDTMNCEINNLELITRGENMIRNSCSLSLTDGYVAFTICGKSNMHLYKEVLADKKLIQAKRLQLILNRTIKKHDSNSDPKETRNHERKSVRVRKTGTPGKKLFDKQRA